MAQSSLVWRIAKLAVRRPTLLPTLLAAAWRFRARDWYRRAPYLPLPSVAYLDWRMHTAYGEDGAEPDDRELERYLRWAAGMRRTRD